MNIREINFGTHFDIDGGHVWLPSGLPCNQVEDGNVDVHVQLLSDESYVTTFYTLANIEYLLDKWRIDGECANGLYTFDSSWVVIREITQSTLATAIEDLIRTDAIQHAMQRSEDVEESRQA